MVVEGAPDRVVVVDRDRVVDPSVLRRQPDAVDPVLERELRRVDSDHDQPVVSVGPRPGADVRLLAQPVDAGQCPEVHQDHAAPKLGGAERLGVEPLGRPAERGNVHTSEHGHLPKRPESRADLFREELGLFPGGEMAALVEPVVVDEVGVRLLRPTLGSLVELVGEDAHGDRDLHALDAEERELVLRVEAARGDRRVRQPEVRDVVQDVVAREALGLSSKRPRDQGQALRVMVEQVGRRPDDVLEEQDVDLGQDHPGHVGVMPSSSGGASTAIRSVTTAPQSPPYATNRV